VQRLQQLGVRHAVELAQGHVALDVDVQGVLDRLVVAAHAANLAPARHHGGRFSHELRHLDCFEQTIHDLLARHLAGLLVGSFLDLIDAQDARHASHAVAERLVCIARAHGGGLDGLARGPQLREFPLLEGQRLVGVDEGGVFGRCGRQILPHILRLVGFEGLGATFLERGWVDLSLRDGGFGGFRGNTVLADLGQRSIHLRSKCKAAGKFC
jgi:hypothetical protein